MQRRQMNAADMASVWIGVATRAVTNLVIMLTV
jgi:hypothetical protein